MCHVSRTLTFVPHMHSEVLSQTPPIFSVETLDVDFIGRQFCIGRRGLMHAVLSKPFSIVVGETEIAITESVQTPHDS